MCGSMADIQSAAAEIRRGKKKKEERRTNHSMKIYMVSLLHRATIIRCLVYSAVTLGNIVEPWNDVCDNRSADSGN